MNKAKLDIEDKLVPKGPNVVRHLTLPEDGQSLEWILAEMDKMDHEQDHNADWRRGKISGAVYRMLIHSRIQESSLHILHRWRQ